MLLLKGLLKQMTGGFLSLDNFNLTCAIVNFMILANLLPNSYVAIMKRI